MSAAAVVPQDLAIVVSAADIKTAVKACATASAKGRAAKEADAEKKIALMAVFEPLLGIKTADELEALSLDQVRRAIRKRLDAGVVKLKGISVEVLLERVIQNSQVRRNVSWKDAFVAELGESRATAIIEETAESHSYKFVLP